MTTWIALLRGINVGGGNKLPMQALREIIGSVGLTDVRTYIQSGNAVFNGPEIESEDLAGRIADAIAGRCGFRPGVVVLDADELQRAAFANPFPAACADPKTLHLYFLVRQPGRPDLEAMEALAAPGESVRLIGKVAYLHAPDGIGRSRLAARVERLIGVAATARNWRTVATLLDMTGRPA